MSISYLENEARDHRPGFENFVAVRQPDDYPPQLWEHLGLYSPTIDVLSSEKVVKIGSPLYFLQRGVTVLALALPGDKTTEITVISGAVKGHDGASLRDVLKDVEGNRFLIPFSPRVNIDYENERLVDLVQQDWKEQMLNLAGSELGVSALCKAGELLYLRNTPNLTDSIKQLVDSIKQAEEAQKYDNLIRHITSESTNRIKKLEEEFAKIEQEFGQRFRLLTQEFVKSWQGVSVKGEDSQILSALSKVATPLVMGAAALLPAAPIISPPDMTPATQDRNPPHIFEISDAFFVNLIPPQDTTQSFKPNLGEGRSLAAALLLKQGVIAKTVTEAVSKNAYEAIQFGFAVWEVLDQMINISDTPKELVEEAALRYGYDPKDISGGLSQIAALEVSRMMKDGASPREALDRVLLIAAGLDDVAKLPAKLAEELVQAVAAKALGQGNPADWGVTEGAPTQKAQETKNPTNPPATEASGQQAPIGFSQEMEGKVEEALKGYDSFTLKESGKPYVAQDKAEDIKFSSLNGQVEIGYLKKNGDVLEDQEAVLGHRKYLVGDEKIKDIPIIVQYHKQTGEISRVLILLFEQMTKDGSSYVYKVAEMSNQEGMIEETDLEVIAETRINGGGSKTNELAIKGGSSEDETRLIGTPEAENAPESWWKSLLDLAAVEVQAAGLPTEEPSPTPTPAQAVEPTPKEIPIDGIVESLKLNPEREYKKEGAYLIDTYNGAKMAKLSDKDWVDTSLDEKYGHLLPSIPNRPYQEPNLTGIGQLNYFPNDRAYESYTIRPIYTGNIIKSTFHNPLTNTDITLTLPEVVIRNLKNEVVLFHVFLGSDDLPGKVLINIKRDLGGGSYTVDAFWGSTEDILGLIQPGNQIETPFFYRMPEREIPVECNEHGYCSDYDITVFYLYSTYQEQLQELVDELKTGQIISDSSKLILPPYLISIFDK